MKLKIASAWIQYLPSHFVHCQKLLWCVKQMLWLKSVLNCGLYFLKNYTFCVNTELVCKVYSECVRDVHWCLSMVHQQSIKHLI